MPVAADCNGRLAHAHGGHAAVGVHAGHVLIAGTPFHRVGSICGRQRGLQRRSLIQIQRQSGFTQRYARGVAPDGNRDRVRGHGLAVQRRDYGLNADAARLHRHQNTPAIDGRHRRIRNAPVHAQNRRALRLHRQGKRQGLSAVDRIAAADHGTGCRLLLFAHGHRAAGRDPAAADRDRGTSSGHGAHRGVRARAAHRSHRAVGGRPGDLAQRRARIGGHCQAADLAHLQLQRGSAQHQRIQRRFAVPGRAFAGVRRGFTRAFAIRAGQGSHFRAGRGTGICAVAPGCFGHDDRRCARLCVPGRLCQRKSGRAGRQHGHRQQCRQPPHSSLHMPVPLFISPQNDICMVSFIIRFFHLCVKPFKFL